MWLDEDGKENRPPKLYTGLVPVRRRAAPRDAPARMRPRADPARERRQRQVGGASGAFPSLRAPAGPFIAPPRPLPPVHSGHVSSIPPY